MTGFATRMASPSFFTLDGGGGVKKLDEPIDVSSTYRSEWVY